MIEFPYFFIVGLNMDEDGKIEERHIEQRFDAENANICSGWLKNTKGYDRVFVYGGIPLKWVGEPEIFEIYERDDS